MVYPIITRDFYFRENWTHKPCNMIFFAKYSIQFCTISYISCL